MEFDDWVKETLGIEGREITHISPEEQKIVKFSVSVDDLIKLWNAGVENGFSGIKTCANCDEYVIGRCCNYPNGVCHHWKLSEKYRNDDELTKAKKIIRALADDLSMYSGNYQKELLEARQFLEG